MLAQAGQEAGKRMVEGSKKSEISREMSNSLVTLNANRFLTTTC